MHNPIIEFNKDTILYPGEQIAPLNPCTNQGYIILPYYYVTTYGRYFSTATGRFQEKTLSFTSDGYADTNVSTTAGQKHVMAHRGVLATFAPVYNMYALQVDHIDGNHTNNNLSNLRWVTSIQNNNYAKASGIAPTRSRVITDDDIINVMKLAALGLSDKEISDRMEGIKIAPETVRFIRTGQAIYGDVLKKLGLEPIFKREHENVSEEDKKRILELASKNISSYEISELTGINARTIRNIILRTRRAQEGIVSTKTSDPIIQVPEYLKDLQMRIVNIDTSPNNRILPIYGVTPDGRMFSMGRGNKWTELTLGVNHKGYNVVGLLTDNGNKQFFVHRIVLSTFNPIPNMYDLQVNHINGIRDDNRLENLEWVSRKENMQHAADNIITKIQQRAPDEDIIKIVKYAHAGYSDEEISVLMNDEYTPQNIRIIRSGLKTYGPVLEQLHLEPFKYHHGGVNQEDRYKIYEFIESRLNTKGMMDLYVDAGAEFGLAPDSVRRIYRQEKAKNK